MYQLARPQPHVDHTEDRTHGVNLHHLHRFGYVAALVCLTLFAIDLYGVESGHTAAQDRAISLSIHGTFGHGALAAFSAISTAGGVVGEILTVILVGGALLLFNQRRGAVLLLAATIGGEILSSIFKALIARTRPHLFVDAYHASGYSFPSGHTTSATVLFGILTYLAWSLTRRTGVTVGVGFLGFGAIAAIGLSRVVLGVHYPTDVAAGFFLGSAWVTTLALISSSLEWGKKGHLVWPYSGTASSHR